MDKPEFPPVVILENDALIVWDERLSSILYNSGFYGKPMGLRKAKPGKLNRPLVLSFFDGLYLLSQNVIRIQHEQSYLEPDELITYAENYYHDFRAKYHIYRYLRDLGYVVRPGMKFGSDFVLYKQGPGIDHSQFVVHVESDEKELRAIEVVRAGRLAASVRKGYLIATRATSDDPIFYSFDRVKI